MRVRHIIFAGLAALTLFATACSEDASDDDDGPGITDVALDGSGSDVPRAIDAADTTVDDAMDGSLDPDASPNDAGGDVDEPVDGGDDPEDVMPDGTEMTDVVETDGSVGDVTSDTDQEMTDAAQDVTVDATPDTRRDIANITCPPPDSSGCGIGNPTVIWAKDPATGACCEYTRPCLAPSNWQTYPNKQACLSG